VTARTRLDVLHLVDEGSVDAQDLRSDLEDDGEADHDKPGGAESPTFALSSSRRHSAVSGTVPFPRLSPGVCHR
jgi:hypothetical protein